jgi:hypothetical protein
MAREYSTPEEKVNPLKVLVGKSEEILESLSDYWFLKKDSVPWS